LKLNKNFLVVLLFRLVGSERHQSRHCVPRRHKRFPTQIWKKKKKKQTKNKQKTKNKNLSLPLLARPNRTKTAHLHFSDCTKTKERLKYDDKSTSILSNLSGTKELKIFAASPYSCDTALLSQNCCKHIKSQEKQLKVNKKKKSHH
jgi:hypothetical protein